MSKTVKLQQEELQSIKSNQDKITQLIFAMGNVELQKSRLLEEINIVQSEQDALGKVLSDKYGEGDINFESGLLTLKETLKTPEETTTPSE